MKRSVKKLMLKTSVGRRLLRQRHLQNARRWSSVDDQRLTFYRQFVGEGDLVFDVGANLGNRSKIFLELGAAVVGIEPQPYCAEILEKAFRGRKFTCVRKALGDSTGTIEMHINAESVLSTVSTEWIDKTCKSGRFEGYDWIATKEVELTTLDEVIAVEGLPKFLKIDVEGFEHSVLMGLSRPIQSVSLEFAGEAIDIGTKCIERLGALATYEFQFSQGESMVLDNEHWLEGEEMIDHLRARIAKDPMVWGDLYARMVASGDRP